jgi:hypothetical protein
MGLAALAIPRPSRPAVPGRGRGDNALYARAAVASGGLFDALGDLRNGGAAAAGPRGTGRASERWAIMDGQTKREIWILAIGTALLEAPVAMIAYAILTH